MGRIRSVHWWGNDTIWRTCLDLKRILLYAGKEGNMRDPIQLNYQTLIDGVIAGEGNGPLAPIGQASGTLICWQNPVVGDTVASRIMASTSCLILLFAQGLTQKHIRWPLPCFSH